MCVVVNLSVSLFFFFLILFWFALFKCENKWHCFELCSWHQLRGGMQWWKWARTGDCVFCVSVLTACLPDSPEFLSACLAVRLPACVPAWPPVYLPAWLSVCVPGYPPASLYFFVVCVWCCFVFLVFFVFWFFWGFFGGRPPACLPAHSSAYLHACPPVGFGLRFFFFFLWNRINRNWENNLKFEI